MMTAGRAVAEIIRRHGVTHVFCVPGESYLPVIDAFYDMPDVQLVLNRHEGGSVFCAEGYAKASGRAGVAMATRGVGAGNLAIGVHTARQDSTPLVVLLGQVPTRFLHREAFQEVDLAAFFRPVAKWAVQVEHPARVPELVAQAFRVATAGRPGPVVVALPEDVLDREVDFRPPAPPPRPRPRPAPDEVESAVRLLLDAERPGILAGGGVLRAGATPVLVQFAEALAAPVFAGFRRFDVFPNDHPLFLGGLGMATRPEIVDFVRSRDVLLVVGSRLTEFTTQGYTLPAPETRVIQVDIAPEVIGAVCDVEVGIVADAGMALGDLLEAVRASDFPGSDRHRHRREAAGALRAVYERITAPRPMAESEPVDPEGVMHDLQAILPPEAAIVTDAGNFSGWPARFYRFRRPGTHFGPISGAMGYGLPAAIGVAMATPGRPVVCLAGDGGFLMTANELETAVRHRVPVVSIVFHNGMYGTMRMHQERRYPGRPIGWALGDPGFADLARAMGAHGERVERNRDFPAALRRALAAGGPAVMELITRPERLSARE
ncbi:thiamine pyrophosphate-dependent enzyme [Caldinitratiruptor microaerophilus]|uniref:thiamine pyrophosphate-dependent enzyme n=1 Tax=Caldinitratiruptor microaerophilus TaxID=671077 RepID=UPI0022314B75|nr:thiamine pyrophosphate-dependent enzyme [Caldinitratiruptor microaerophilus]